jgi:enoyl-CoA hydratase
VSAVRRLVLDRSDKLNAFDQGLRERFTDGLRGAMEDRSVSVVVISGEGRAFSVGADVRPGNYAGEATAEDDRIRLLEGTMKRFLEVWEAPKPVIAQVHGYCLGIATVLCACCDLVVAAEDAVFGWPKLPLGAGMIGPTWAWSVGIHKAKELSYQVGSEVTGAEAARLGFANAAVPASELESYTDDLAARIARTPADLLRIKKEAINGVANRAGFRETIHQAASWDALAHECASVDATRALIGEHGVKGAIAHFRR